MPRVVHVLAHGNALCGLAGAPSDWPRGHVWVSAFEAREAALATCPACRRNHIIA